jgi:ribosomal protein S18 acetylase RimI-like enzyme
MTIMRLGSGHKKGVMSLFRAVTKDLQRQGILQWDWFYPNGIVIGNDLRKKNMFGLVMDDQIVAAVVLDTKQSSIYAAVQWRDVRGEPACIHRLAVRPEYQGKGLGKQLLQFAEGLARKQGNTSIRLDVYTGNPGAVNMYSRAGYQQVGEVLFPFRQVPYMCFEKQLT